MIIDYKTIKDFFIIPAIFVILTLFNYTAFTENTKNQNIRIIPDKVFPGDAFYIRAATYDIPELYFQNRRLLFNKKNQYYEALGFVEIDTKPGIEGITSSDTEHQEIKYILVLDKKFAEIDIVLKSEKVFLRPEDEKRADAEERVLKSIWNYVTPEPLWYGSFIKPIDSSITSEFGTKRIINKKKVSIHRGTDYKGAIGTPVKSINSGEVVLRDNHFFGGNTLMINHGLGIYSVYLHLSDFNVDIGDNVNKGQVIGFVGNTGRSSGPHLHLSVKLYGESINPESLFKLNLQ